MVTLFYVLFGLNIIHEIINIVTPNYPYKLLDHLKEFQKKKDEGSATTDDTGWAVVTWLVVVAILIQQLMYFVLSVLGLFTHQWQLFAMFLCLFIVSAIIQHKHRTNWYAILDSVISAVLIVTIIINR